MLLNRNAFVLSFGLKGCLQQEQQNSPHLAIVSSEQISFNLTDFEIDTDNWPTLLLLVGLDCWSC